MAQSTKIEVEKFTKIAQSDFQTLAKELTNSELNEEFDEFEGLLSDFVGITIPESGVYQGFDSGDFDSGNM